MMNFHSESVAFVVDFCVSFSVDFLGPSVPLNEGQKIHREIHSKIHDIIPAKSTHVAKNGVGKSTLQKEGSENHNFTKPPFCLPVIGQGENRQK